MRRRSASKTSDRSDEGEERTASRRSYSKGRGSPAEHFRNFLSREMQDLQRRVLAEFERDLGELEQRALLSLQQQQAAADDDPAQESAEDPTAWPSMGSEALPTKAGPLERWANLVSEMLLEDSLHDEEGPSMAGLACRLTLSMGNSSTLTNRFHMEEEHEEVAHPDWLDTTKVVTRSASVSGSHIVTQLVNQTRESFLFSPQTSALDRCVVLHPDSPRRLLWCSIGALLLVYDAFTVPMEAAGLWSFSPSELLGAFLAYWVLDIFLHLCTGYHHDCLGVEMRLSKTMKHYARGSLPVDLVIVLLDVVFLSIGSEYGAGAFRLVRLARFARLIRIHKWFDAFKSYMRSSESAVFDLIIRITRVLLLLLLICHMTACAWFAISNIGEVAGYLVGGNWVDDNGIREASTMHLYVMALHWSITQFTPATNDVVPVSTSERIFAVFVVLVGMLVFSGFLSSMTSAVNELKSFNTERTRERYRLVTYMKSRSVTPDLSSRVLNFFSDEKQSEPMLVEADLPSLLQLPVSARIWLHAELFLPFIRSLAIVSSLYCDDAKPVFFSLCHLAMSEHSYLAEQEVFVDAVETETTYMVVQGKLEYNCVMLHSKLSKSPVSQRSVLAECALWLTSWSHKGSLVARTVSNIAMLDCNVARKTIKSSGFEQFSAMRCFAVLFAHHVHLSQVTDLGPDSEVMEDLCTRSLRFCKVEPQTEVSNNFTTPNYPTIRSRQPTSAASSLPFRLAPWISATNIWGSSSKEKEKNNAAMAAVEV